MSDQIQKIYVVEHEYEKGGYDRLKFIGVFASRDEAKKVVRQYKKLPGFKDWPKGFIIFETQLGECQWTDGFGPSEKLQKLIDEAGWAKAKPSRKVAKRKTD